MIVRLFFQLHFAAQALLLDQRTKAIKNEQGTAGNTAGARTNQHFFLLGSKSAGINPAQLLKFLAAFKLFHGQAPPLILQ